MVRMEDNEENQLRVRATGLVWHHCTMWHMHAVACMQHPVKHEQHLRPAGARVPGGSANNLLPLEAGLEAPRYHAAFAECRRTRIDTVRN